MKTNTIKQMKKRNYLTEEDTSKLSGWIRFYKGWNFGFRLEKAGYFDERPVISSSITQFVALVVMIVGLFYSLWFLLLTPLLFFGYVRFYWNLPIKTGIEDCQSAAWGITYVENSLLIYYGGAGNYEGGAKCKIINLPWTLTWVRTSTLLASGEYHHQTQTSRKSYENDEAGEIEGSYDWLNKNKWQESHPYIDKCDGTVVTATISVEEREWRPLWFQWTSLFAFKRKEIKVDFDQEVGSRKGSWKGGTIGCGYDLKAGESPLEALKRMEQERKM
jgi:hypothetical protein